MIGTHDPDIRRHYETLGLAPGAGLRDVKKRARQLFLAFHPDLNPRNRDFCEEKTKSITAAYGALLVLCRLEPDPDPALGRAQPAVEAEAEALVFELAHRVFAVSTAHVRGVLRLKDVRLDDVGVVSDAFPYVSGAFFRDEELVMLWNLHAQLGLREMPVGSGIGRAKLVHAECDAAPVGFLADDVLGVSPAADVTAPAAGAETPPEYLCGMLATPHGDAALLDLRAMLYHPESNF